MINPAKFSIIFTRFIMAPIKDHLL